MYPTVVRQGAKRVVFGDDIVDFTDAPMPDPLLTVWVGDTQELRAPPGGHLFAYPLAGESNGQIVLVWGEPDSTRAHSRLDWPPPTKLWSAVSLDGVTWSDPVLVLNETSRVWGATHGPSFAASRDGVLHLATPVREGLMYLRYEHGWHARRIPTVDGAAEATIVSDTSGTHIVVAFLGALAVVGGDENSVFVTRSDDAGGSWSAPALVRRSGAHPAFNPILLRTGQNDLDLLWAQDTGGDELPDAVMHYASNDAGVTWAPQDSLSVGHGILRLLAAGDRCGAVHVLFEDWTTRFSGVHTEYVRLVAHHWTDVRHLFAGMGLGTGTLVAAGDSLSWIGNRFRGGEPISTAYMTMAIGRW